MEAVVREFDAWAAGAGELCSSNHYMVTHYADGAHHIGFHHDKAHDMHPDASIAIVKVNSSPSLLPHPHSLSSC